MSQIHNCEIKEVPEDNYTRFLLDIAYCPHRIPGGSLLIYDAVFDDFFKLRQAYWVEDYLKIWGRPDGNH